MILNKHNLDELNKNGFFIIKNLLDEKRDRKISKYIFKKKKLNSNRRFRIK